MSFSSRTNGRGMQGSISHTGQRSIPEGVAGASQSPHQTYALQAGHDPRFAANYPQPGNNDMGRLEALVAVATSENRAAEQRS